MSDELNFTQPSTITSGGMTPKAAKGGVYAPADVKLIKDALLFYTQNKPVISEAEERQAVNLLHRLNNRI